jgi:phosphate transport system permease protein
MSTLAAALRRPWPDRRAERTLGAAACLVLAAIALMVGFVVVNAWPSFAHNGLAWFGAGGNVDQQLSKILNSPQGHPTWTFHAWTLIYGTALITALALLLAVVTGILTAAFVVEFAPPWLNRALEPAVRLLAAVPSVVYGLIGILVLAPFVGNHLVSTSQKESVAYVIPLTGESVIVAVLVLAVMIAPIMIAIVVDALRAVPRGWSEGAIALGVNPWRALWSVSLRAVRPVIVAAAVLSTARALGEAIMLSMVSGSKSFAPNPLDGLTFFYEPTRTLAATIVEQQGGTTVPPLAHTLYAMAAVLMVSTVGLSFAGWWARRSLARQGLTG